MRTLWFTILLTYCSLPWAQAQGESDDFYCAVPAFLCQAFQKQHPEAEGIFWEHWKKGFKASFYEKGSSREVCFSSAGQQLMSCTYLEPGELPAGIRQFLASRFPDWETPSLLARIERPQHSTFYRVHFDLPQGMLELILDEKGQLQSENMEAYHREED